MKISNYDFQKLHNSDFIDEFVASVRSICEKNAYIEGEYNDKVEAEIGRLMDGKTCHLVANCTDALEISLQALGVGPGDVVAVSAISFFASAECVINRGATPVFVDVDPDTGLMCANSLKQVCESHNIKATILVHIYGQPTPMRPIEDLAKEHSFAIIEDAAQAFGARYDDGGPVGGRGHLACFSFYPTKNLGALGDAGCIVGGDAQLMDSIKSIRNHGRGQSGHELIGRNSRCDSFQAAALWIKMRDIQKFTERRKEIASRYFQNLEGGKTQVLPRPMLENSCWHLFPVLTQNAKEARDLEAHLKQHEIWATTRFYGKSLKDEPTLTKYPGECPQATAFAERCLCLPLHPHLSDEDVDQVCSVVREFYK